MAESTLSLSVTDLCREVGYFLGMYRDDITSPTTWSTEEQELLLSYVNEGYRRFLGAHDWTFLKPTTSLVAYASLTTSSGITVGVSTSTVTASAAAFYPTMVGATIAVTDASPASATITAVTSTKVCTAAVGDVASGKTFSITADGDYRLPDDFAFIEGQVTFGEDQGFYPLMQHTDTFVRARQQWTSATGRPECFSIRPLTSTGATGQRFNMRLWPIPDQNYTLHYRYRSHPAKLTTTVIYPLGGMAHASTIMESCLAVAEERSDDTSGVHGARYREFLQASIAYDRNLEPDYIGMMCNPDGSMVGRRPPRNIAVTYEGSSYYSG